MADHVDIEKQLKEIKQENNELKSREQEAKLNMEKAAEYGQQLLYELSVVKMSKEKAEQEVYELTNKLEREVHTSKAFEKEAADDIENLKETIAKLTNDKELSNLQYTAKIDKINVASKEKNVEYEETIRKLEEKLETTAKELDDIKEALMKECERNSSKIEKGDKSTDNEEIAVLQEKILQYQDKIQDMIQNNKQLVDENNDLLDRVQSSQNYASELKASLEEAEAEAMGYQQSLSHMRTDLVSKQNEISDVSPETATNERGNSLFSEVDDRRQIVEGNYKKLKEQFSSMKVQYDRKDQQLMKVKTQNVALLNRASANEMNPDHGQLYHLQDLLEREKNKNKQLTDLLENLKESTVSDAHKLKDGTSIHDSIRLQIRQNLETEEKNQQLTRKLITLERNEKKMKAENYQLKTELTNLKQSSNTMDGHENDKAICQKSNTRTVREFVKFDSTKDNKTIREENRSENHRILQELSATSKSKQFDNCQKKSGRLAIDENEISCAKPRKTTFSDAEPIVCEDSENTNTSHSSAENSKYGSYGKKQSTLSGIKSKRPTNNLINAKEESEKLKEQCAQQ